MCVIVLAFFFLNVVVAAILASSKLEACTLRSGSQADQNGTMSRSEDKGDLACDKKMVLYKFEIIIEII